MVQNLSETVGELTLDSDTAIINKSDADSSSSEKVCLCSCLFVCGYLLAIYVVQHSLSPCD